MITADQLERFYGGKGINANCPVCGNHSWQVAGGEEGSNWALTSVRDDGNAVLPAPAIPIVAVVCSNCFYIRSHALKAIERWLQDNQAGS